MIEMPGAYPRITIIIPSLNQRAFIERTMQSVLVQNYPNQEYIVIDGGSRDDSVEVIRRNANHLTDWYSEPDRGQSHAITNGLRRATGQIVAYLNSDDRNGQASLRRLSWNSCTLLRICSGWLAQLVFRPFYAERA